MADPALLPAHSSLIFPFNFLFVFVIDSETPLSDVVSDFDLNCRRFRYLVEQGWVKRSENER